MSQSPDPHRGHRFPAEIIAHAVWLYHVFSLSLRDVELLLAERGVIVSYESVRRWCLKFGRSFADKLRRRRPRPGDTWQLDEVFLRINGEQHYLWRAVDQHGVVLDILVQNRRNAAAAKRFFKRLLRGLQYKPRRLITDGLRSYGVAKRAVLPEVRHRTSRYLNNRAENSHRPTRRRERPDATVQITIPGTAVPIGARYHLWSFPPTASPDGSIRLPALPRERLSDLATGDVYPNRGITLCVRSLRRQ